jgi:hypothetical protein
LVIDIVVNKTDDGVTAEIPGIRGCEVWAHDEDTALDKILELAAYYLKIESKDKLKVDLARKSKTQIIYKLIFNKN